MAMGSKKKEKKKEKFVRFVHGKVVTELSAILPCNLIFSSHKKGKDGQKVIMKR